MLKIYRTINCRRGCYYVSEITGRVAEPAIKTNNFTKCIIECEPLTEFLKIEQTLFKVITRADIPMRLRQDLHMLAFIRNERKGDRVKIVPFAFPDILKTNIAYREDDPWCLYNVIDKTKPIVETPSQSMKCVALNKLPDKYTLAVEAMEQYLDEHSNTSNSNNENSNHLDDV